MNVDGQPASILVVCQIEKLLEQLGIQDRHQKVIAGVIVRDQGKERHFLLSQRWKIQIICSGQRRKG